MAVAVLLGSGCGDDSGAEQGTLGGPCYPNDTCNDPLLCVDGTCQSTEPETCGDGTCDPGESPATCPADCPACAANASRACYSGPEGTEGVGACQAGTETCLPDGSAWGPCEGEVLPTAERCDTPEDDDCDGEINEADAGCQCDPGEEEPCYSGPAGTAGVGTCHAGTHTCQPDGLGWGTCEGEVTPVEEICANGLDDDCDGLADNVPDLDGDGFTRCEGDCCETTAECPYPERVNPAAVEVPTPSGDPTMLDENCDGQVDEPSPVCDVGLLLDDADPVHGAAALGLCQAATPNGTDWGLVSAAWVRANGQPAAISAQMGLLDGFGPNVSPREGQRLLVLSTGRARTPTQPDACGSLTCNGYGAGTAPAGFPQDVPSCPGSPNINDDVGLEVTLRAPSNALGFAFDFKFYSFEYPEWVCTSYNDQFVVLMSPPPQGSINGNIAFDAQSNPVSVNVGFLEVCAGCPLGTAELLGTGFDTWNDAGATGWLTATAPVTPGQEFTLRFTIWDTGDQAWDSTVLIDNFRWLASSTTVGTTPGN